MRKQRAIAVADRATPHILKLVTAANLLFLGSFLAALAIAVDMAQR